MKIYLASTASSRQRSLATKLREEGHLVYDPHVQRGSIPDADGTPPSRVFDWSLECQNHRAPSPREIRDIVRGKGAQDSFQNDMNALVWSDVMVLEWPAAQAMPDYLLAAGLIAAAGLVQSDVLHRRQLVALIPRDTNVCTTWLHLFNQICVTDDELISYLSSSMEKLEQSAKLKKQLMGDV